MASHKRCKECIISEKYPDADIDEGGVCSFCTSYQKEKTDILGEEALRDILAQATDRKSQYDCAVAFSGGKDSTYVLYQLKEKYKLKILAITGEDYIASDQAWENRFRVTKKLGVDHIIIRPDWQLYKEVYRSVLISSGMAPRAINLVHNLMHEKAVFEVLNTRDIPFLVTGNSQDEIELFKEWEKELGFQFSGPSACDYWNNWRSAYIKVLEEILPAELQKKIPDIVWPTLSKDDPASRTKHIPFFLYEPFDVGKNMKIIRDKLGWKLPSDVGGTETDSAGLQFCVHSFRKLHGDEEYAAQISKLVRSGNITREIAWKAYNYRNDTIVKRFFDDFQLSWENMDPENCTPFLKKWLGLFLPIR
ncbi:MAG: hypothetical protein R3E13_11810 [Alphaproteobacteria bacterium]